MAKKLSKRQEAGESAYALMVMLGDIDNEFAQGNAEPVSYEEIQELYDLASKVNDYFEGD